MQKQAKELDDLCRKADASYRHVIELTLKTSGNNPALSVLQSLRDAILEFREIVKAVADIPAVTTTELRMKAQVASHYLSPQSGGQREVEQKLLKSLIKDAVYADQAWSYRFVPVPEK